jgi:hypothetical protein
MPKLHETVSCTVFRIAENLPETYENLLARMQVRIPFKFKIKKSLIPSQNYRKEVDIFADKFCRMVKVPNNDIQKFLDKFLENKFRALSDELFTKIDDVRIKFHCQLENKTFELQKVQEQFRYKTKSTQAVEEKMEDLEAKLNVFEQEKLATHVAICGIPGGHQDEYYFDFFDNFVKFLSIPKNRIKCKCKYEAIQEDAPQSQRNPDVFVLENEEQKILLLEKVSKFGRINFGDVMNCACKNSREYRQRITCREMITNYNASLLRISERYIHQGKMRDAFFEDGYVNIKTNRGDIIPIKSFGELEEHVEPVKKDYDSYDENFCPARGSFNKYYGHRRPSFEEYRCYDYDEDSSN